jgi:endonuclease/exonuclease/phosphatase family metal-dependent hydrolase
LYAAALLAVWGLTTHVGEAWWVSTAMIYAPRLGYGLPLVPLALLAALFERRLLFAHAACLLFLLGPLMGWRAPARGEAVPAGAVPIRVLTYNVGGGESSTAALLRTVVETAPDVVVTEECSDLGPLFPGWTTRSVGEIFVATRLRLVEVEGKPMEPNVPGRQVMRCQLIGPRGPFNLFVFHLFTPRRALEELKGHRWHLIQWRNLSSARGALVENAARRARQSAGAAAWIAATPGPRIVAGDFNLPVDSPTFRTYWSNYRDAFSEAGSGYGYTFPGPFPWTRIDHILVTPEWGIARAWVAPGSQRDHLPVIADLWMR